MLLPYHQGSPGRELLTNMRRRTKQRAERVNQECDLGALLHEYGYSVFSDGDREQQFACNLHGQDNKPSARLYGATNSTYCWACSRSRDPLAYVMEIEGLSFLEAVRYLEKKLNLPPIPWGDEDDGEDGDEDLLGGETWSRHDSEHGNQGSSADRERDEAYRSLKESVEKTLISLTRERELSHYSVLGMWEVFDLISISEGGPESVKNLISRLSRLRSRIKLATLRHDHLNESQ